MSASATPAKRATTEAAAAVAPMKTKRTKVTTRYPPRDEIFDELAENGYMVIPAAVADHVCEEFFNQSMDYMEGLGMGFKRDDKSTHGPANMPLSKKKLIQNYNVGWQSFTVKARVAVKAFWQHLWDTDDVVSSFDGASISFKTKVCKFKDLKHWKENQWDMKKCPLHIDQTTVGFKSVQGGLALSDQEEDEHTYICVPGSQKLHEEFLKIAVEELKPGTKLTEHWVVMGERHIALMQKHGLEVKRIAVKRGDLIIWDSRTVHASASYCKTASKDAVRVQVFAAMLPAIRDETAFYNEQAIRQKAYNDGLVSKHSARNARLFGKKPRVFSKDMQQKYEECTIPKSAELSDSEKRLHGLLPYELINKFVDSWQATL